MKLKFLLTLVCLAAVPLPFAHAGVVDIHDNQLFVDGKPQPQLFGAEVQYFRMRGGQDRNIPREKVLALWGAALDKVAEAKMNAISFYIPWDFHEYAEGKFDFRGDVDEDGDGKPDYPSRDLFTFFKMAKDRGIKHIMVRPGPYINAEWGFLGFGAVPEWFHKKFPESHMIDSRGRPSRVYDYHSPEFHEYTRRWFTALYDQVLKNYIGPGQPVDFVQLDNETNFEWTSLYNGDFGPRALSRYREFVKEKYKTISALNSVEKTNFANWEDVQPAREARKNLVMDRDWYEFQDESIHSYLKIIRKTWEEIGVREPTVLFTLAESYNALEDGLLPNYRFRNDPKSTGMMTVNLYPKTFETEKKPLFNLPFKADHDVKAADAASDFYLGKREEWVLGPEIQGGWWRGIDISREARRQTYLTVIGHGLKAMFVYYFNEGDQYQSHWLKEAMRPYFEALKGTEPYKDLAEEKLPYAFWKTLQHTLDTKLMIGIDTQPTWERGKDETDNLFFDAPLDKNSQPRQHYYDLKELGQKVIAPHQDFLGKAVAVEDRVCIVKDSLQHEPSPAPAINSLLLNGEWGGALLGYLMQTGLNPRFFLWGLNPTVELNQCDLIFWQDTGLTDPTMAQALQARLAAGATVVSFLEGSLARGLGIEVMSEPALPISKDNWLLMGDSKFRNFPDLLFHYRLGADARCSALATDEKLQPSAYHCAWSGGGHFVQVGAMPYQIYNSNDYAWIPDSSARLSLLRYLTTLAKVSSRLEIPAGVDLTVAFARTDGKSYWITAKTGSLKGVSFKLKAHGLDAYSPYRISDLLQGGSETLRGSTLDKKGFPVKLGPSGSTVYFVEKQ